LTLVVDSSVAVKWFFSEPRTQQARALLNGNEPLIAPSLVLVEIANAAWKRLLRGHIDQAEAELVVRLSPGPFSSLVPIGPLLPEAAGLAFRLSHPVYDCLFLALAARDQCPIITADERLAALAQQVGVTVRPLA